MGSQPILTVHMWVMESGPGSPGPRQWSSEPPNLSQPRSDPTGPGARSCAILEVAGQAREQLVDGGTGKFITKRHDEGLLVSREAETQEEQTEGQPLPQGCKEASRGSQNGREVTGAKPTGLARKAAHGLSGCGYSGPLAPGGCLPEPGWKSLPLLS